MLEAWWAHFSPHPTPSDPDKPHIPNTLKTRVFERIWRPIQCAPVGLHPRRSGGTFGGIFRILRGLISRCPQICPQMTMKALTDVAARNARPKTQPYKFSTGGGLYLEVMPNGAKYWRMQYRQDRKRDVWGKGVA